MKTKQKSQKVSTIAFFILFTLAVSGSLVGGTGNHVEKHQVISQEIGEKSQKISIASNDELDICTLKDVICNDKKEVKGITNVDQKKKDILVKICKGMPENCWKTLYAMHLTETRGNCKEIGDSGKSRGCYQIQTKMHNVSISCAEDFTCSSLWTLNNLKGHGYPMYLSKAVRKHNGSGNGTLVYLSVVNNFKNNLK